MSNSQEASDQPRIGLITGGSRGIGKATALDLAKAGGDVIITYRDNRDEAETTVKEVADLGRRAVPLALELGDARTFEAFADAVAATLQETWGRDTFDYLVNNAGSQRAGSLTTATEEDFDALVGVQFKGLFFLTQKVAPLIADNGSVVNISSGMTRFYVPERVLYSATKGAVEVLTRYLAQELGGRGIRVNTIAPGATATDFSGGLLRDNPAVQQVVASMTALGRHGVAEDISGAIVALLDDANRWVTGQRIEVAGGVHL
jgi:NAD(P)-dependent dehydrogenase (short-subunit alcohol dehydrogenase family)